MIQWLVIRKSDRRIQGWHRSGKGTVVPVSPDPDLEHIEADEAKLNAYFAAEQALGQESRAPEIFDDLVTGIKTNADTRPIVSLQVDKTEAAVGEAITLTITRLRPSDLQPMVSFTGQVKLRMLDKILRCDFTAGVCVKVLAFPVSGDFVLRSTQQVKVNAPVSIEVVE